MVSCQHTADTLQDTNDDVVLRLGSDTVRLAAAQAEIDQLPPLIRQSYAAPQERRAYLQKWVNNTILLHEALRLGYERDPEVLRAMHRAMILKLLTERIGSEPASGEITEAAIAQYYREHPHEFGRPEEVRVTQIVVNDQERARAVLAEAHEVQAHVRTTVEDDVAAADLQAFRRLVFQYSEDPASRQRGGDLTLTREPDQPLPQALINAGFQLRTVGEVSPIITTDAGFHIVKLRQRIAARHMSLDDVRPRVIRRIAEQRRDRKVEELVATLTQVLDVQVFEDRLAQLRFGAPELGAPAMAPAREGDPQVAPLAP
jgi:peptidyl-prolyl cis-trans isomerase C